MNNKIKYLLITILCILIIGIITYIVLNKKNNTFTNTNIDTTNIVFKKIDESKEWVYDAEYEKNTKADSYETEYNTYYAKDIIAPFFNMNSTYATNINTEIKEVLEEAISIYNEGVENKSSYIDECNYKKYIDNNTASVIFTYGTGSTSVVHPRYYTYNINLSNGNPLTYEEVYTIAGLNSSNIETKVVDAITSVMKDKMKNHEYTENKTFDTYNNVSINNYKDSVNNNTIKYFLGEDKKLNVIVTLYIPADTGEFDTVIKID